MPGAKKANLLAKKNKNKDLEMVVSKTVLGNGRDECLRDRFRLLVFKATKD